MGHCYHHALSSVRQFGGEPEDYLPLHNWFDESKAHHAGYAHRMLRHHAEGVFMLERFFGVTITNSAGRIVPVRLVGEQHLREDFGGFIPCFADWARHVKPASWMMRAQRLDQRSSDSSATQLADGRP